MMSSTQENPSTPPRLGLALSGGTAKVIAHVGVLKALEEENLIPDLIAGTSGGSMVAVIYASGMDVEALTELARELNWKKLARIHLPKLGLLSSERLEKFMLEVLGDLRFEDLKIPTKVIATNLLTGQKTVFSHGRIAPVIRASCSIPQIFAPVEIDGGLYTDGGVVEYLPLNTLEEFDCQIRVGVHLGAYLDFSEPPQHILGMIMRVIGLVAVHNAQHSARLADVLIKPDLRGFGGFDLERADALIEAGYVSARQAIPDIKRAIEEHEAGIWKRMKSKLQRKH
jgi:NTE family protein